jgi:hypothetical protein
MILRAFGVVGGYAKVRANQLHVAVTTRAGIVFWPVVRGGITACLRDMVADCTGYIGKLIEVPEPLESLEKTNKADEWSCRSGMLLSPRKFK